MTILRSKYWKYHKCVKCVSGSDWTVRDCRQSLPNLLVCQEDEAYYASAVKTF